MLLHFASKVVTLRVNVTFCVKSSIFLVYITRPELLHFECSTFRVIKVARLDFLGAIPLKFENKLRRH